MNAIQKTIIKLTELGFERRSKHVTEDGDTIIYTFTDKRGNIITVVNETGLITLNFNGHPMSSVPSLGALTRYLEGKKNR